MRGAGRAGPGAWCGVVWCGAVWCGVVWCGGRHVAAPGLRRPHLGQRRGAGIALNLIKNPIATAVSFTVNDMVKELLGHGKPPTPASF